MKFKLPKKLSKTVLFQLVVYFVLIIAITLCASSYFTYVYFSSYFKTEVTHLNRKVLNQLSIFTDDFTLKNINVLLLNLIMNNLNNNYIKEFLDGTEYDSECLLNLNYQLNNLVLQNNDIVDSILVYSNRTEVLAGTKFIRRIDPETDGKSPEFSWIATFLSSGKTLLWMKTRNTVVYSDPTKNTGDVITVVCSYPLASQGGDMKGCIALNIKEKALSDHLVQFNSLNKGQLIIIDNTGAVISNSKSSGLYDDISHEPFVKRITENAKQPGSFTSEYGGREYVISYAPSSFNNWIYISMVPSELFYQQDYMIKKNLVIISLAILLIVFILSDIFSYKLYVPLRKVIDRYLPDSSGAAAGLNVNEYKLLDNLFSDMSSRISGLQSTLNKNALLIRNNFLMGLLTNRKAGVFNYSEYLEFLNIPLQNRYFLVVVFAINKRLASAKQAGDLLFFKYRLIEFVGTQSRGDPVYLPVETDLSTIAVIVNAGSADPEETDGFIAGVMDFCLREFSYCPVAGVGTACEAIEAINRSYIEARLSVQYKFLYPEKNAFRYEAASPAAAQETAEGMKSLEEKIDRYLKLEDTEKLEQTLRKLPGVIQEKNVPYIQAKREVMNIAGLFGAYAAGKSINLRDLPGSVSLEELKNAESIFEFIDAFLHNVRSAYGYLAERKLKRNTELVRAVKEYIADNLQVEISLNSTAEAFMISPFYLSKIFKEETGCNYIDYVVGCKMKRAKELLASTGMELEKITERVGYSQTSYFSRKFKEHTGMTPIEYRRKANGNLPV